MLSDKFFARIMSKHVAVTLWQQISMFTEQVYLLVLTT